MNNNKYKVILIINISLFAILTILMLTNLIKPIDSYISSFVIGIRNDNLTKIFTNITNIGGAYSLIVITILLIVLIKDRKIKIELPINLVSVFIISQIIKFIIRRDRPNDIFLVSASGYSYPSGHTMVSTAYFGLLIYLIIKNIKNKLVKTILVITLISLIILISLSRIYLGVHYASDILAGVFLALAYLTSFIMIKDNLIKESKK